MTFKQIGLGSFIGLISGTFLGLFLKWVQSLTGIKVYVLLLNVDFIPMFTSRNLPEWLEFLFHILISCVIGVIYMYISGKMGVSRKGAWILSFLLTLPTVFLYFPLSYVAIKDVPDLLNGRAILLWTAGHILYALTLPPLYFLTARFETRR